jgi:hypothetical protein
VTGCTSRSLKATQPGVCVKAQVAVVQAGCLSAINTHGRWVDGPSSWLGRVPSPVRQVAGRSAKRWCVRAVAVDNSHAPGGQVVGFKIRLRVTSLTPDRGGSVRWAGSG